ncbi:BnaC08g10390D [Brassica napus]|uniref:Transcription elongation factor 1 homolog n=1 Tax=Brassica napus TaxID=3708 RepID=A0A078ILN1_BRANA|nr:BnaC08g10390D [Brassica napus]
MGKRKLRAKPATTKRMDKLDTVIGIATCRICEESFSTTITALSEAIDIYSEWIDECERVNAVEDDVEQEEEVEEEKVYEEEEEEVRKRMMKMNVCPLKGSLTTETIDLY